MAKFSSIPLTLLFVVIAAYSVQSLPHRPKRDLKLIKSLLSNTIFGKETIIPASPALQPLVIRHSPGKYRIMGLPEGYKSVYIRRYPQDVIVKDDKTSTADSLGILESYLGTKTQQESLSALNDVNNLLQSGIITVNKKTEEFNKKEPVQPLDVQYEMPTSVDVIENGVYSYELHLPSNDQPQMFSQIVEVPEPEVGSFVSGEGRTSYEVPLSTVQKLQKSKETSNSEGKEFQNVEHVMKIPKLETGSQFDGLSIPIPIASSKENGFYYIQVQSDGSIAYYRDDGTTVQTSPMITPNSDNLVHNERMQKICTHTPAKVVKSVPSSKLYLSRLSDKAIVNDVYAKGYTVIDNEYLPNGYKESYNVPSKYVYKQISLDGNTLYYNDNSKNNIPLQPFDAIPREFLFQRMKNLANFKKVGSILNQPFTSRYVYKSLSVNDETHSKEHLQNFREDFKQNNKQPSRYYYKLINPDGAIVYYKKGNNVADTHDHDLEKEQKTPLSNFATYSNKHYNNPSTQTYESSRLSNPYLSKVEVRVNEPQLQYNKKRPSDPFFYSYSQTGGNHLSQQSNDLDFYQENNKSYEVENQPTVNNEEYSTQTTHIDGQYSYLKLNTDRSDKFDTEEKHNSTEEPKKLTIYAPSQYVQSQPTGKTSGFNIETETTSSKLYQNSVLPTLNEREPSFRVISDNFSENPKEAAIEYSTKIPKDEHSLSTQQHNNNFSYILTKGTNSLNVGLSTITSTPSTTSSQYSYKLVQGTKQEESSTESHKDGNLTTNSHSVNRYNNIKYTKSKTEREYLQTTTQKPLSLEDHPIVVLPINHSYSYRGSNVDVQGVDDQVLVDIRFGQHEDENEDTFQNRGDV